MLDKKTTQVFQALLICEGFNDEGTLLPDGRWGSSSIRAAIDFIQDRRLHVANGQDITEVLREHFMGTDYEFDLQGASLDVCDVWAFLITQGFGYDVQLGVGVDHALSIESAIRKYLDAKKLTVFHVFSLYLGAVSQGKYFKPKLPSDEPVT